MDYENYATASTANARFCSLFYNCKSLTTAPALPVTTLANDSYNYMFYGCTGLTTAPELPAISLKSWCYLEMFKNCTSLSSITMLSKYKNAATSYFKDWVSGVAATGTFTKAAEMTLSTGTSGIPEG